MANEQQSGIKRLDELFAAEPDRLSRLSFEIAGLYFDWSKTHLDQGVLDEFAARAVRMDFAAKRDALFSGEIVNVSEGRPRPMSPSAAAASRRTSISRPRVIFGPARWSM